jgi:hypothetical protein
MGKRTFIVHLEIRVKERRREEGFGEEGCTLERRGAQGSLRAPSCEERAQASVWAQARA